MTFNPTNPTDAPDFTNGLQAGGFVMSRSSAFNCPTGVTTLGPWYVGNIPAIMYYTSLGGANGTFTQVYFTASNVAGNGINGQTYYKSGTFYTTDIVPVAAPWVWMVFDNETGGAKNISYSISALPTWSPYGMLGAGTSLTQVGLLAIADFQALASGAAVNITPVNSTPGPASVSLFATAGTVDAQIVATAGSYNTRYLQGFSISATGVSSDTKEVILPNDDWELIITNRGAASCDVQAAVMSKR